jgi:hypothetical protein
MIRIALSLADRSDTHRDLKEVHESIRLVGRGTLADRQVKSLPDDTLYSLWCGHLLVWGSIYEGISSSSW